MQSPSSFALLGVGVSDVRGCIKNSLLLSKNRGKNRHHEYNPALNTAVPAKPSHPDGVSCCVPSPLGDQYYQYGKPPISSPPELFFCIFFTFTS